MMNVPKQAFRNRRASPRASVLIPASVVTISAYQYLEVVDLSPTGAKLRGQGALEAGKAAMFRLDQFHMLCQIVWAKDDECGVRFDEPVPPRVFAELRKAGDMAAVEMLTSGAQPADDDWASAIAP